MGIRKIECPDFDLRLDHFGPGTGVEVRLERRILALGIVEGDLANLEKRGNLDLEIDLLG